MTTYNTSTSLVDIVVSAARITGEVYKGNMTKLASRGHGDTALVEAKRAALMQALAEDDNLCEMFAGRLHQFMSGQGKPSE